jgi:peptide/nickel transport system substrate-binding protein
MRLLRALLLCCAITVSAHAESVVTVAMTAGDIPITTGIPDQGSEGVRFVGYTLYDALVLFDLSHSDQPADLRPGLATSWAVDPENPKRWIFKLREGVKWHDGCPFVASDVVWNFKRILDKTVPQFDPLQFALGRTFAGNVASVDTIDDHTVAIAMDRPHALFPGLLPQIMLISPCNATALKYDRDTLMSHPSGTGPYRIGRLVPHERLELLRNDDYWDKGRVPKHDKLVLLPMPEASTRAAALLSGQVNFIEAPDPDAIPRLKSAGMNVIVNSYPHNWAYQLNFVTGPFTDIRVRKAANHAINRDDVVELLGGTAMAGYTTAPPGMPYYGNPVKYEFDPGKATALLKEAGCYPCKVNFAISTSGSGQMHPLPMNELVKSQLDAVGFDVTLTSMDWNALLNVSRGGVDKFPEFSGVNISRNLVDPFNGLVRHVWSGQWAPVGGDWGHYKSPETEALVDKIFSEFDDTKRNVLLTELHEEMSKQAVMIWVAHDLNPRALSPKLKGFVQARSWFQDLTPIVVTQ